MEIAHGLHGLESVADFKFFIGESGEPAAVDALDADAQHAVIDACADRIGPAHLFAVEYMAESEILSLYEIELIGRVFRRLLWFGRLLTGLPRGSGPAVLLPEP